MPRGEIMLQPGADWTPTEWASAEVQAVIGAKGAAELKRGINLGVSGEIGVSLAAMVANYVAVDASAEAHASVELKGQAQVLLDLFEEVGVAIRLRASAELGASVKLGIGLSTKQFMNLAKEIDLIGVDSVQMELLEALLDETVLEAGIAGKAAFSAMAYANLSITGRLIRTGESEGAGFYLVGDFGAGFEGGAGYQMFAKVGLRNPSRLIRKTVDIAVDRTIEQLTPYVGDIDKDKAEEYIGLLWQLRAPAKMAMRMAYETGMALSADKHKHISKDIAKEVALGGVKIAIEEAQPYVFELLMQWAIERLQIETGVADDVWKDIARLLVDERPQDPFSVSVSDKKFEKNIAYWNKVIKQLDDLVAIKNDIQETVAPYLGMVWCSIQLLFIVARFAEASSSEKDAPRVQTTATIVPPKSVMTAIAGYLGEQSLVTIEYKHLIQFILKRSIESFDDFVVEDSAVETIIRILVGGKERKDIENTLRYLIENTGVSYSSENQSQLISLDTVQQGLNWYMQEKVEKQLKPVVLQCDADELIKNMLTDVLIASLSFTTDKIITAVLDYSDDNKTAIREACSAILMRLLARSLVVTTDILLATAMNEIQTAMGRFDKNLHPVIDELGKQYKTARLASVLHEAVDISAKVFHASGLIYQESRPEIRNLLYKLIDGNMQFPIKDEIPHRQELVKLATHIVTQLEYNIKGFAKEILLRIGERLYVEFQKIVDDVNTQVNIWKKEVSNVRGKIEKQLALIKQDIIDLKNKINGLVENQVKKTNNMIDYVSAHPEDIKRQLSAALHNKAMESAPKKDLLKKTYIKAVDKAVGASDSFVVSIVVTACKELKKSRDLMNAFLGDARKLGNNKKIAECFGDHLGRIVAIKLQITIPIPGKPIIVKVPENAVRAAFRKGAGLSADVVTTADQLIGDFKQQIGLAEKHRESTAKSEKLNNRENDAKDLVEAKPADDAKVIIVYPSANEFIPQGVDVAIKIRFEKIPVEYLATKPLAPPRVLIWVNQKLVDLNTVELDLEGEAFILTLSPHLLRDGPNLVTVAVADSQLNRESVGFFMAVQDFVKENGLGISDSDIDADISQAKTYLVEKSNKALEEVSGLLVQN